MASESSKRRTNLRVVQDPPVRVAEFFAGIGLARLGLEQAGAEVVWANDLEENKASMYRAQFGTKNDHMVVKNIYDVAPQDVPKVDIAWASFPCTDLSLAGNRDGLKGKHSSTFHQFANIIDGMRDRKPSVIAIENVVGFATSHSGQDIVTAIQVLNGLGYSIDVLTLDARRFVPQSRPRLFLVGSLKAPEDVIEPNSELRPDWLQAAFNADGVIVHRAKLPAPPAPQTTGLEGVVEKLDDNWWDKARTQAFISSLSKIQAERLEKLRKAQTVSYRTAYRRTRKGISHWEIRADDIAGCLRTARGGSSKQALVQAGNNKVKVRWMNPVEYARLMGAKDYNLDGTRPNQAFFGFGDAVCVPAVTWLAEHYLIPLAREQQEGQPQQGELALEVACV